MENKILEILNITPEQLKKYLDKKQKIRDQTAARNKIYKIRNAEKLQQSKDENVEKRQQLKQQLKEKSENENNEVVKIPRKYTKKTPINNDVKKIETRGRKRKNPKIETDKSIKKKPGRKIKDVNILDLVDFLK